jgi:transposase-like protein
MNLGEVYERFPTEIDCVRHLEEIRWKNSPICPYCSESRRITALPKEGRHHCNNCNTTFSVTVRTIFHRTRLPLQKWFLAVFLILDSRRGVSARQLAKSLNVNKNTAWYLSTRISEGMLESSQRDLLLEIGTNP